VTVFSQYFLYRVLLEVLKKYPQFDLLFGAERHKQYIMWTHD
jgi:hypothetical protein